MTEQEIPLDGGNVTSVIRIGETVHLSYAQDMQALGLSDPELQARRLKLFCQAYGLMRPYKEVLDVVEYRLEALCSLLLERAHDPAYRKMIEDAHLDHYRREIASFRLLDISCSCQSVGASWGGQVIPDVK